MLYMQTQEWISDRLEELNALGRSKTKIGLAKALGIQNAGLHQILKGGRQVKTHEAIAMSEYLEMDVVEVLSKISRRDLRASPAHDNGRYSEEIALAATNLLIETLGDQLLSVSRKDRDELLQLVLQQCTTVDEIQTRGVDLVSGAFRFIKKK